MKRILSLAWVLIAGTAFAAKMDFSGTASTSNQSIWAAGPAFAFDLNGARFTTPLVSSSSDVGIGVSCSLGVCLGYDATISGSARLGIAFDFTASAGTVSATIPALVSLDVPDLATPGQTFSIHNGALAFRPGSMSTTGPGIFAGAALDLLLTAGFSGRACAGSCTDFGSDTNLMNIDTGTDPFILFTLNRNNNGRLEVGGGALSYAVDRNFQVSDFLTASIYLPKGPNTTGTGTAKITSSGTARLADLDFNVTNLLTELARLPPAKGSVGGCCGLVVDYNLVSVDAIIALAMSQDFSLTPYADLYFNVQQTGERIHATGDTRILFPQGASRLDIVPEMVVGGHFVNATGVCAQPTIAFASLGGTLFVGGSSAASFGPLFNSSYAPGCFGVNAYTGRFDLGGFNTIRGDPFTIFASTDPNGSGGGGPGGGSGADPAAVPEPATYLLTGCALAVIGFRRVLRN